MPKPKKCKECSQLFNPWQSTQIACSVECAAKLARKRNMQREDKKRRIDTRKQKERLKSRSDWLREAQTAFNTYIRARDEGRPCISCGRHHQGQIHAGHYRTTKAASSVRFNAFNVHAQCQPCNTHLSGNVIEYRKSLIKKYGAEIVERIESDNRTVRYTPEYLQRLKKVFSKRARHIKRIRQR